VQERYTPKGMMGKEESGAQGRKKREGERSEVHRGFRHPKSKQRDANLQRKRDSSKERKREIGKERERQTERDLPFLLFRARRCLIRLTAKQPRRGLIKKGIELI